MTFPNPSHKGSQVDCLARVSDNWGNWRNDNGGQDRQDGGRVPAVLARCAQAAERIVVELKDKLQDFATEAPKPAVETDVLSALENLGYSRPVVEAALRRAVNGDEGAGFEVLFKRALQILTKE